VSGAFAAVDLGATSGRVMLGYVGHNELALRPVARFPNGVVTTSEGLHWDVSGLYRSVLAGLSAAVAEEPAVQSIGVDSWAVDYALLAGDRMLGEPHHYRDARNLPAVDAVHSVVSPQDLYAANGLQHLPFNTLYQFTADRIAGALDHADGFLLIPDLIGFWLTGHRVAELTNASTTGLLSIQNRKWDDALIDRLGLPRAMFPQLVEPGTDLGPLRSDVTAELGIDARINLTTVGSHDTASAVVAVPSSDPDFAYISCGTWGLVGVELERPVLSEASRLANFTNEGGVDGRVRYLHNVMGLWLLSESVRTWEAEGATVDLPALLDAAAAVSATPPLFDANDPRFLTPGDMPARIADWLVEHGERVPATMAEMVRCIIESLADAFVAAVLTARELSGATVNVIHIVGGGSQNVLLCQLVADRSGLPVFAGPVEATAIGNVLVQARTAGAVSGSLEALRSLVASAFSPKRYLPRG
jgi:rhamnulokinase